MKIKVIDLLNKIANGEEVPEKIEYGQVIFEFKKFNGRSNYYNNDYRCLGEVYVIDKILNVQVEIIEENKPIEPINVYKLLESPYLADLLKQERYDEFMEHIKQSEVEIVNKLIKVIDEMNKLKENK